MVERVAYGNGHPSVRAQHAHHLAQGSGAILEEHETELAYDSVEPLIREREQLGSALPPFDPRALAARHRQHVGVGIKARDGPLRSDAIERRTGKNPGPASNIQYPFAGPYPGR